MQSVLLYLEPDTLDLSGKQKSEASVLFLRGGREGLDRIAGRE